ncbi:hypothetical protein G9A89_002895 [Geosiphon pyriformis]|nr:hypothetical protein G9A89_002895 [Geosiphon pyriformis]
MGRPIVFLALLFTLLALVSAELSINTPFNQPKGSKVAITWTWDGPDDAKGSLLLRNKNTGNSQILLSDVLLNQRSYQWNVDADPGTYNLILQAAAAAAVLNPTDLRLALLVLQNLHPQPPLPHLQEQLAVTSTLTQTTLQVPCLLFIIYSLL